MLFSRKSFPVAVALLCLGTISPSLPAFAQTEESQKQPLLSVEGTLEPGDTKLEDGSFYDSYTFEGRAGQTVTIVLESIEFDTYLLLLNSQEEKIAENDDFSEKNSNSALTVTLPEDGVYRLIANTYDTNGQGRYEVTVSPSQEPKFSEVATQQIEASRLSRQGVQQYLRNQFRAAIQSWQQALQLYQALEDRAEEGTSLNNIGEAYRSLGEYETAIEFLQQSLAIRQEIGDITGEGTSLRNLGNAYRSLGKYEIAIDFHQKSLAIQRKIGNRAEEGNSLNDLGVVYSDLGEYEKAIEFYQQSLTIARELGNRAGESRSLNNLGTVYSDLRHYEKAIEFHQQSLTVARELGNRAGEGISLGNLGNAYESLGEYETAINFLQQSLVIAQEVGNRVGEGNVLGNLGNTYTSLGDYEKALDLYQQSLIIHRKIGNRAGEGQVLVSLGLFYKFLGQYEKAIDFYKQSLVIQRELGNRINEGAFLSNLGNVYSRLGEYEKAINFHQQSLTIARELGNHAGEGNTLGDLGTVYNSLGQYEKAINLYQQSLTIARELGNRAGEGNALGNLGIIHDVLGEYEKAIDLYQQSLVIQREMGNLRGESSSLTNLGSAYKALEEYEKAIDLYQQSLAIDKEIGNRAGEGNALGNLGIIHDAQGEYEKAIDFYQQSLVIQREIGDRAGEGASLNNLGVVRYNQEQYLEAEKNLYTAINVWESLRSSDLPDADKISFFDTQARTYRTLQQTLIAQNKTDRALEISERGRARALVELLTRQLDPQSKELPQIDSLSLAEIKQIAQQQNATLVEYSIIPDTAIFIWVIQPTGNVEFRAVDLEKLDGSSISIDELRNLRQTLQATRGSGKPEDSALASLVRGTETALQGDGISFQEHLRQLHKLLIAPIAELLPTNPEDRVIFIPHESLFRVPFAALQDTEFNYLIEKHTILTAPSIQSLTLTRQHQERIGATLAPGTGNLETLIVGNPIIPNLLTQEPYKFPPLPNAEEEAQDIAKILNTAPPLLGNAATETEVVKRLHSANIIHLATHGLFETNKLRDRVPNLNIPGLIALTPSGTEGENDGFLTAGELVQLTYNNPLNADLVVLSACETGLGTITGDGVIGLSRALIAAGVPSIVVSLWQVPDTSTQELMTAFYTNLYEEKMDKAQALRQAMLQMLEENPTPGHWSGFTLIGEAE
ncbi:tetratricopeptide repeat protein [Lusitaniella coriacea LEGE 07157]|uniref:Tetratricopeptide repeat protein n=1 Tax=Lusitaniella coriacea LEGE 07157 TaxID=945747 RepID=A0A8J7E0F4_9CYAN|nr:tetratricopeptide repeat protein [Lusitaniella coriacea]MBE9119032.1 tetratricopeptide repeat protein [Lusitaniella coriacea LEGE 07157]